MSQENVEVVRRLIDTGSRENGAGEGTSSTTSARPSSALPGFRKPTTTASGQRRSVLRPASRTRLETFEVRLNRISDAGAQVVALTHLRARAQASGAAVDAVTGGIFTLRDVFSEVVRVTTRRVGTLARVLLASNLPTVCSPEPVTRQRSGSEGAQVSPTVRMRDFPARLDPFPSPHELGGRAGSLRA